MMRPRRAPGLTDWVQVAVVTLDESTRSPHKNVNIRQSSNTGSINGLKVQCEGFGGILIMEYDINVFISV